MASVRYVRRFSRTERALHWIHASAFFVLLGTGLVLYLPSLSIAVSNRPLVKAIHVYTAIAWVLALVLVVLVGDRSGLGRTFRELDLFDGDDRRWLAARPAPQGRFNAGQKLNAALTGAFAVLFAASGFLLWYGERNTDFRWTSTLLLHDGLTIASVFLVTGHLYLAVIHPATRHALRGMTLGSVREDWATRHHAKWVSPAEREMRSETAARATETRS
ncbi:MAG: formate dehydrogenase subunit gamma [Gaiellaceae bacterium]|nr:MAG: formate dehydrogenase subunit gamma [Gaiellaceae bacterium]